MRRGLLAGGALVASLALALKNGPEKSAKHAAEITPPGKDLPKKIVASQSEIVAYNASVLSRRQRQFERTRRGLPIDAPL